MAVVSCVTTALNSDAGSRSSSIRRPRDRPWLPSRWTDVRQPASAVHFGPRCSLAPWPFPSAPHRPLLAAVRAAAHRPATARARRRDGGPDEACGHPVLLERRPGDGDRRPHLAPGLALQPRAADPRGALGGLFRRLLARRPGRGGALRSRAAAGRD